MKHCDSDQNPGDFTDDEIMHFNELKHNKTDIAESIIVGIPTQISTMHNAQMMSKQLIFTKRGSQAPLVET